MKVKAVIKNQHSEWAEVFDIGKDADVEDCLKSIIEYFNDTLKAGETPRQLVSFTVQKYSTMENAELTKEYLKQYDKFTQNMGKYALDEIWESNAKKAILYFKKNRKKNKLWLIDYIQRIPIGIVPEVLLDIAWEIQSREWKRLRK